MAFLPILAFGDTMIEKNWLRGLLLVAGLMVALAVVAVEGHAQNTEGFLYGKVVTGRTTYIGPIRWGGEEVLWTDMFNASKVDNNFMKLVPKEEQKEWWQEYDWSFSGIWKSKGSIHQFNTQFGNIKELNSLHSDEVIVKLKNGVEVPIDGSGTNDVGADIQILDDELGVVNVSWGKIDRIEFMPTPEKLEKIFGQPLYGTVEGMRREKFTGYIVWDNDERLQSDKLDGDSDDGDVAIKFSDIDYIEKERRGSFVKLKSGRELYLTGSNDVNAENRGVLVAHPDYGVIKFSWDAFKRVQFEKPKSGSQPYQKFPVPSGLFGTVSLLDGDELKGRIIYDVDESLDFEHIEGRENDIEYQIPIRLIKRITPKNFDYSLIELRSGQSLLLGGMRDVSDENSGLLVFVKGKKDPVHVSWKRINEIIFN